jgi:hypothetical protein
MAARAKPKCEGFGFCPEESVHHFVVTIPASPQEDVLISEHLTYDENGGRADLTFSARGTDGKLRVILARAKWNAIADEVRVELNRRLRKQGLKTGQWKVGENPLSRLFGKELTLLAWAIEDADPGLIPVAIKNWLGLVPEERWWLYTMTCAATGHAVHGRGKGWRRAVRYALTENPVNEVSHAPPPIFRLEMQEQGSPSVKRQRRKG